MAHNRLCIYIIHYVQFIILGENPGNWKLWTDYDHYELPEPLKGPPRRATPPVQAGSRADGFGP